MGAFSMRWPLLVPCRRDHRIGYTQFGLGHVMDGDIQNLIDALVTTDQADRLGDGDGL